VAFKVFQRWEGRQSLPIYSNKTAPFSNIPLVLIGACPREDTDKKRTSDVQTGLGGGHRFPPDGTGLAYSLRSHSQDFWLLDLAANKTHPLTHLSDHGAVRTFDITRDGKEIVFDHLRTLILPTAFTGAPICRRSPDRQSC
jgi:hypothetical protein